MHGDVLRSHQVPFRRPAGLAAGPAYFGPLAVCGIAGHVRSSSGLAAEVAALTIVVAVVGYTAAAPAGLLAVGSAVLSFNGFGQHEYGELGWEPGVDGPVAVVLLIVWAVAWAARGGVLVGGRSQSRPLSVDDITDYEEGER